MRDQDHEQLAPRVQFFISFPSCPERGYIYFFNELLNVLHFVDSYGNGNCIEYYIDTKMQIKRAHVSINGNILAAEVLR